MLRSIQLKNKQKTPNDRIFESSKSQLVDTSVCNLRQLEAMLTIVIVSNFYGFLCNWYVNFWLA